MKLLIVLTIFTSPLFAFAQTGTTTSDSSSPQATTIASTTPPVTTAITVASINLANTQIMKVGTTSYAVSFSLLNTGETQKGVRYIILLAETDGGIVMMQSFDKELTLEKGKVASVNESFAVPKGLTGTFSVQVRALTSSGLPLGSAMVGEITVQDIELLRLLACATDEQSYSQNQILKITCDVREIKKGTLASMINGGYLVVGDVYYNNEPSKVQSTAAEIQNGKATLSLPGLSTPGTYTVRVKIQERDGTAVGKEQSLLFTIRGVVATILNTILNKDIYQKGDSALATLSLKVITVGTTSPLTLTNTLLGEKGVCASPVVQEVGEKSAIQFEIPITTDCIDPTLTTEIKNAIGTILASSTVSYKSPVREDALKKPTPSVTSRDRVIYGGTGAFGIFVGILSVFIARRRAVVAVVPNP